MFPPPETPSKHSCRPFYSTVIILVYHCRTRRTVWLEQDGPQPSDYFTAIGQSDIINLCRTQRNAFLQRTRSIRDSTTISNHYVISTTPRLMCFVGPIAINICAQLNIFTRFEKEAGITCTVKVPECPFHCFHVSICWVHIVGSQDSCRKAKIRSQFRSQI